MFQAKDQKIILEIHLPKDLWAWVEERSCGLLKLIDHNTRGRNEMGLWKRLQVMGCLRIKSFTFGSQRILDQIAPICSHFKIWFQASLLYFFFPSLSGLNPFLDQSFLQTLHLTHPNTLHIPSNTWILYCIAKFIFREASHLNKFERDTDGFIYWGRLELQTIYHLPTYKNVKKETEWIWLIGLIPSLLS